MSDIHKMTFVLKTLKHGTNECPMYAVVGMNPSKASVILDKRNTFREAREGSQGALQEMSFSSKMVGWVERSEVEELFQQVKCEVGDVPIIESVEDYGKSATSDMPSDLPVSKKVECETLHLGRYGCKWRVYRDDVATETVQIPYRWIESIVDGTFIKYLHPKVRAQHDAYIRDWVGWDVNVSEDHYGSYWITEIEKATNPDLGGEENVEETDRRVKNLLQASPRLYVACRNMLSWIDQARNGTLSDMESAMGRKCPYEQMKKACEDAV